MAYTMKGGKAPGSSYRDQEAFATKGLYGPTDDGAHDGPGDDKTMIEGIKDRFSGMKKTQRSSDELDATPDTRYFGEPLKPGTQNVKTNIFGTKVTRTDYDDGESVVFKERKSGKKILKGKNIKVNIADDASRGHMLAKTRLVTKSETTPTTGWTGEKRGDVTQKVTKQKTKYKSGSVKRTKKRSKSKKIETTYAMDVPGTDDQAIVRYTEQAKGKTKWTKGGYQRRSATSADKAKGNIKKQKTKMHTRFDTAKRGQQNEAIDAATKTTKYRK